MAKNQKQQVKESWYVFFIIFLSGLLLISISFFLHNPLTQNLPVSTGLKPLGSSVNLALEDNGSSSQSLFFYGSFLPDFGIEQEAFITLKANQNDCKVRAKVFMFDENNNLINMNFESTTDWVANVDGYSYYNGELTANLSVQFLKKIKTPPSEAKLSSNNIYIVILSFETIPTTADYETIWKLV